MRGPIRGLGLEGVPPFLKFKSRFLYIYIGS
jgi:hypothetical protein